MSFKMVTELQLFHTIDAHPVGVGGGVLEVRTPPPPFWGTPKFIKREKMLRAFA